MKSTLFVALWGCVLVPLSATSALSADEASFYRGINVGGEPVTIDGRRWDGDDAANFECDDKTSCAGTCSAPRGRQHDRYVMLTGRAQATIHQPLLSLSRIASASPGKGSSPHPFYVRGRQTHEQIVSPSVPTRPKIRAPQGRQHDTSSC